MFIFIFFYYTLNVCLKNNSSESFPSNAYIKLENLAWH